MAPGVPAFRLTNSCLQGRYRIEKTIFADPTRDVLLLHSRFVALRGSLRDYAVHALLAPHLGNRGWGNTGWVGEYKGVPMLFAEGHGRALALACSAPWRRRSAGYVGFSDAWQDLVRNGRMTWEYARAESGNVALAGEIAVPEDGGAFTLALGFGASVAEAAHLTRASLDAGLDEALARFRAEWDAWHASLRSPARRYAGWRTSAMVLRVHEAKCPSGGVIASLSVPWGTHKGDDDLGGYHLVWPRDLVEAAGGFLAAGACENAREVIGFLRATQEADGHWPQNMWLDGTPYWSGVQMDETALPILLVDLCHRRGALREDEWGGLWPMVRAAAAFLVQCGPVTAQDRWEEDGGYSPYTLATEIAALLAAADLAEVHGERGIADYLRETADAWNEQIEAWTYVRGTDVAERLGVDGYYVRIAPVDTADAPSPIAGFVPIKNRPPGESTAPASHIVSPDALALVRFGLRAADDPRIVATLRVIDALLRVETPQGPCFRRYNGDGYGEHEDGSPFDGTGIGRLWPLLTAERAHLELSAGRRDEALRLLETVERFANEGGLLPEQVWDGADLPEYELWKGRATGSAMPLVWAHAEYLKLVRSLEEGAVFDQPLQTVERYQVQRVRSSRRLWRPNHKLRTLPAGSILRIELGAAATVRWSADGWKQVQDTVTRDTGIGVHVVDLPTAELAPVSEVVFTFRWRARERWEGVDHRVAVVESLRESCCTAS